MRQIVMALSITSVAMCACSAQNQTSESQCKSPTPTYSATTNSSKIWDFVHYVEVCQPYGSVRSNFARERAALEELVRRKDPKAMYQLGLELENLSGPDGGSEIERARGRQLQARALQLGYREPDITEYTSASESGSTF